ncbi:MAG: hypothetical protein FK730_00990 [Asgard group archaeon]|nr:hypothetical protein [Asgard group archaeon]
MYYSMIWLEILSMKTRNACMGILGLLLIIATITTPFWNLYGLVNGSKDQIQTSNMNDLMSKSESLENISLKPAPSINSFFEQYSQDFIHTESSLPNDQNNIDFNTNSFDSYYDENLVANIDLSKLAYGDGELVEYIVQVTSNFDEASNYPLRILIIEGDNYYYWYTGYGDYTIISNQYVFTNSEGLYYGSFLPPVSGTYTILVIPYLTHDYPIARRVVTVSPISAFWRVPYSSVKHVNTLSYVVVADTTDFSTIANANVSLYIENWWGQPIDNNSTRRKLFTGLTSSEGIIVLNYTLDEYADGLSTLILIVEYSGSQIELVNYIWSYYDYYYETNNEYQLYKFITTLDKPIYQPGDIVKARTLVLLDDYWKVTREPVANTDVEVKFVSTSGFALYHQKITTDENGLLEWNYHFDSDAEIGNYVLAFTKDYSTEKVTIELDNYVKPDFRVNINLESEYVEPGDKIKGTINAKYYFGKPVSGTVVIEFLYYDIVMDTIEGAMDSTGDFYFEWRVPRGNPLDDEPIRALVLKVTVTDPINRVVSAEKDVACTSELIAYFWTYPWELFQRGDEIRASFYVYQISVRNNYYWYSWNPVSDAEVTLIIYGLDKYSRKIELFTLESETNHYGSGRLSFTIPEEYYDNYKTYVLDLIVTTSDGRSTTASQSLSLAIIETHVELNPSTDINPGDDLSLTISVINTETNKLESASISVYIMDAEYDTLYYTWDYVLTDTEVFTISLTDFAPTGKYRINTYCRILNPFSSKYSPRYSSHYMTFVVGDDYSLSIQTDKDNYSSTEEITITGQFVGSTNLPIIIELSKKGIYEIIALDSSSTDFLLILDDIKNLGPRLTIFAYAITVTGIVLEAIAVVEINKEINITIQTDKEIYEPGETAQVTITAKDENDESIDAISVFSLIDSSIFAVKEDSMFEETYFEEEYYWSKLSTRCSWTAPMTFWWYWWMLEDVYYFTYAPFSYYELDAVQTFGGWEGGRGQPEFEGEIRDNLPESANWLPNLEIIDGEITFEVPLPDNIGEWTIRLFTYADGLGIITKKTFKTFLPFFVDLKIPNGVVQDNVIIVRGIAYNYLSDESSVELVLDVDGLTTLNNPVQEVIVPKDYLVEVTWSVYCNDFGENNITLTGIATIEENYWYDGIRKPLEVSPNGVQKEFIQSGFLNESEEITFEIYAESIYTDVELIISPGIMETAITSWNKLIGYPYGCIEQTMSKVFPDVMIYHYLNDTDQLTAAIKYELENMLQTGLSKIASNQNPDGGWGWWHDDASQNYMTAVVLYGLGLMSNLGFELSASHLQAGINFLIGQQSFDGSFSTTSWRLDDFSFTAYVIRALLANKIYSFAQNSAIQDAVDYFKTTWQSTSSVRNPYAAALFIETTYDTSYYDASFVNDLITYILSEAIAEDEGIRWEISSDQSYRALGGTVETTATVITALTTVDFMTHFTIIRSAINWLMEQQHYWGWDNTADTSAAIKAIVTVAQYSTDYIDCLIDLELNSWITQVVFNESESTYLSAELFDLSQNLIIGSNTLQLNQTGSGQIYYFFIAKQVLRSDLQIQIDDPITVSAGEAFIVTISLHHDSTVVYPVNILLTNLETEITLIGSSTQSLQILLNDEIIEFSYIAPTEPGIYTLAGFSINYQFADESLNEISDGIVRIIISELTLIVEEGSSGLFNQQMIHKQHQEQFIFESNDYDLTITREYSKTVDIQKGDTIDVSLTINNYWEVKEFVMIEYDIPTGFEIIESSLNTIDSLVDYSLTRGRLTLFLLKLNLGITSINYKITVFDVGSSISLPVMLSSMYDSWIIESEAHVLGDFNVNIDPNTGLPKIDALKPIFMSKMITIKEANRAYDVKIDVLASDNDEIKSIKILFSGKAGLWQTTDGIAVETLDDGSEKYTITLGSFENEELSYIIAIEDLSGNVLYTDVATIIIPAITATILFIAIAILVAFAFATAVSIPTSKLRPKKDAYKIIDDNRDIAFQETKDDEEILILKSTRK